MRSLEAGRHCDVPFKETKMWKMMLKTNLRKLLQGSITTTVFTLSMLLGNIALSQDKIAKPAKWYNDYDDQVGLSGDGNIVLTCPPPGVDFIGPTFEVFFEDEVPSWKRPQLQFKFDGNDAVQWSENYGATIYIGPMGNPYDSETAKGLYVARLSFGTHRAAQGSWVSLGEDFMSHNTVTVIANGVSMGPVSLSGSAKVLKHIAYRTPPCG